MSDPSPGRPALAVLDSPMRRHILDLLANLPADERTGEPGGLTAADLGHRLDLHVTTARFHLDQLVQSELVEAVFVRGGVGRPRKVYRVPAQPLPAPAPSEEALRALTEVLAASWRPAESGERPTPEQAGEQWAVSHAPAISPEEQRPATTPGAWLGKVGRTVDLLQGWGYQPDVRTEEAGRVAVLTLHDCPFLSLAQAHADVVCGVHRGLLRGALRAVGEDDVEVGLQPFVEPRRCLARIATRTEFTPPHVPSSRSAT